MTLTSFKVPKLTKTSESICGFYKSDKSDVSDVTKQHKVKS